MLLAKFFQGFDKSIVKIFNDIYVSLHFVLPICGLRW